MIQIRHNLFETNSSSTHALIISKHSFDMIEQHKKEFGNHIVFGKNSYEKIYDIIYNYPGIDEYTSFQIKADILYFSMYVWSNYSNAAEFLYKRNNLTSTLENLGFTVEYIEDPDILLSFNYHAYDLDENIFDDLWNDVDNVIDFLFNPHTLYYCWSDECCDECPKQIQEAIKRFVEYEKKEEQKVYYYR